MSYLSLATLLGRIDQPEQDRLQAILLVYKSEFELAAGSATKHQAWTGGYLDHVTEVMNLGLVLFETLRATGRELPFTLSDALLVLFLHDLEKSFLYSEHGKRSVTKAERKYMREAVIRRFGVELTEAQANALRYVEGEGDDYDPELRVMNELAAFCHSCDVLSARLWYDYPLAFDDPWQGAQQSQYRDCTRCPSCGWIGQLKDLPTHTDRRGGQHWEEWGEKHCPKCSRVLLTWQIDIYYNHPA